VRALASLDRKRATTLLPEQPKPRRPMTILVIPNLRFFVGMALAGLAQFQEEEIRKPQVVRSIRIAGSIFSVA
jgi:hypothetical protein